MGCVGLGIGIAVVLFFISIPITDWLIGIRKASKTKHDNEDDIINKLLK